MIRGIGCDAVNIDRIERLLEKYGSKFLYRILSKQELEKYKSLGEANSLKSRFIAKRFAAKESVAKAIGTGIGRLSFKNISIVNDSYGKPEVMFENIKKPDLFKNLKIDISISDDYPVAVAFTVISYL